MFFVSLLSNTILCLLLRNLLLGCCITAYCLCHFPFPLLSTSDSSVLNHIRKVTRPQGLQFNPQTVSYPSLNVKVVFIIRFSLLFFICTTQIYSLFTSWPPWYMFSSGNSTSYYNDCSVSVFAPSLLLDALINLDETFNIKSLWYQDY